VFAVSTALLVASPASAAGAAQLDQPAASVPGAGAASTSVARLVVTHDAVSVQKAGKTKFKPAHDGQKLRVGDTVRTDSTGLAEVDYTDDSYTRLDVDTTFTIVQLTDDEGNRKIEGSLDTGRAWNRTSALTESESFEQSGAGATAAVVGTAFTVECDTVDHCVFTAVIHDIDLTSAAGVQQLLTPLDQCDSTKGVLCGDITQISPEDLPQWITQNLLQDLIERGIDDGPLIEVLGTVVVADDGSVFFVPPTAAPSPAPPLLSSPSAPTSVSAVAGKEAAAVSFLPPSTDGGSPITGYTVTASPGGASASGSGSPIIVHGLTNGQQYTFTVTATNGVGTGPAASSNAVTPSDTVVPFGAAYKFTNAPVPGWDGSAPVFDDSGWSSANAPFDDPALTRLCSPPDFPLGNGQFPVNGTIYLRTGFVLPAGAHGLQISGTIDNDAVVYINGYLVGSYHDGSCHAPTFVATAVSDSYLNVGGQNVLAIQATDTGGTSFFDMTLEYSSVGGLATEPDPPVVETEVDGTSVPDDDPPDPGAPAGPPDVGGATG
jgi:hypothetical protein